MAKPVQIEGYELLGLLGRGGMGDVYRARQKATNRLCAIKVTRSDRSDEKSKARFQREAEAMARVQHPHLIRLYDAGSVGDDLWIAIELIEGGSLDRVLAAQGALSPELSSRLMLETCQALDAMHREGLLHRDVKPANVMIERDSGRAVLMDLGLAKDPTKTALTQTGHLLGTPVYLPKEVFVGEAFDPSVDFYSVGITWWELLTGERPYDFTQMMDSLTKGTELTIPPPRSPHGDVPPRHLALIQALTDDRDLRPASLADVEAVLEGRPMPVRSGRRAPVTGTRPLTAAEPVSGAHPAPALAPTGGSSGPAPASPQRSRLALAIPSVGLVLAGLALFFWGGPAPPEVRPTLPPGSAKALVFDRTWADRHSVIFRGAAPDAQAVRVTRRTAKGEVPVPVFPVAEDSFLVWITGLAPGTAVEIEARSGDERMGARAASVRVGDASLGERFPRPLARFHPRDDDPVLRRQFEAIREVVDIGEPLGTELWVADDAALFSSFPDALWPAILALLERDSPVGQNILRCSKLAGTLIPPEVAWHLTHRLADPDSALAQPAQWNVEANYFQGCGVPLALPGRLAEWAERDDAVATTFRLASRATDALGRTPTVPVFAGDAWSEDAARGDPVDPVPLLGEEGVGHLMSQAIRARRGQAESLDELLEVALEPGHDLRDWAMLLLGATRDMSNVEVILDEYLGAEGRREKAADAALMGLRTIPGFWTPEDQPMLLQVAPKDLVGSVEGARCDGGHPAVWKPGRPYGFALIPGTGAVIRIRLAGGEERAYQLRAKNPPKRLE